MIASVSNDRVVFRAELEAGNVAFVDADALPRSGEMDVPPLLVTRDGAEAGNRAAETVCGRAAAVVATLTEIDGTLGVCGRGIVAHRVRALLGDRVASLPAAAAVVDLTGNPETISDAIRRLPDLGTLVLGADLGARTVDLDLYPDVHVRGLRLVGIPDASSVEETSTCDLEEPLEALLGDQAPLGRRWYRVRPRG